MEATAGQAVMTPAGGLVEGSQSTGGTEPRGRFDGFSAGIFSIHSICCACFNLRESKFLGCTLVDQGPFDCFTKTLES